LGAVIEILFEYRLTEHISLSISQLNSPGAGRMPDVRRALLKAGRNGVLSAPFSGPLFNLGGCWQWRPGKKDQGEKIIVVEAI